MNIISYCINCNCKINNSNPRYLKKYCTDCRKLRFVGKNNPMYGKPPIYNGIPLIKGMRLGTIQRQDKPIKCHFDDNGCLISENHTLGNDGYPQIQRDYKRWRLSRWVFYNNFGYLPPIVMHTCDNPLCINPTHLVAGTIKLNSQDMVNKGRAPIGLNQTTGGIKLNEDKVRQIKSKLFQGQSLLSLAKEYNVSKKTILNIKQEKKWKHIKIPFV